jgi:hypothetical protein
MAHPEEHPLVFSFGDEEEEEQATDLLGPHLGPDGRGPRDCANGRANGAADLGLHAVTEAHFQAIQTNLPHSTPDVAVAVAVARTNSYNL